jgi:hypothetical protein
MSQGDSRSRAMRLLAVVRERTESTNEPVVVAQLASACQLSMPETQAAWSYLRDHSLIETFSIPYTARINARGIDALDETSPASTNVQENLGVVAGSLEGVTMRAYGRVDSREALDRAREVSNELRRLHELLPTLTDAELSAYSTKSLPIGTFLHSKGHAFSVLTEDMLANAFKEELERRKADTTADRWLKKFKNNRVAASFVVLAVVLAGAVPVVENIDKLKTILHPASTLSNDAVIARDLNMQIDLCTFNSGKGQVVECVTHGACRGSGSQGLAFPIDRSSGEAAVYSCKQSCVIEAKKLSARCGTPP